VRLAALVLTALACGCSRHEPLTLGTRRDVAPEEREAICADLAQRVKVDQAVRKDPARYGEMPRVDAENTAYVRGIVTDVGWIDAGRFGREAAEAAFLLVQHSGDLPLMLAALPCIEKDAKAGAVSGGNFALLYDRTQLMSGRKQRYGSQLREADDGALVVDRLEDPDRVDEFRASLGMEPLKDYVARFEGEVRIER